MKTLKPENLTDSIRGLLASGNNLDFETVEPILIESVYQAKAKRICDEFLENRHCLSAEAATLAGNVSVACQRIHSENGNSRTRLIETLSASFPGIDSFDSDSSATPNQFHQVELTVPPHHIGSISRGLEQLGFVSWTPGILKNPTTFAEDHRHAIFTDSANPVLRVRISWQKARPGNLIGSIKRIVRKFTSNENRAGTAFLVTPRSLIRPLMEFAGVSKNDTLADFGCGDGGVLIEAVRQFGCRGIGLEKDGGLADIARKKVNEAGLAGKIKIFDDSDPKLLADATVVFAFLPSDLVPLVYDAVSGINDGRRTLVIHEQRRIDHKVSPAESRLLVSDDALTVAHRWQLG